MKILLIQPPLRLYKFELQSVSPPLGLASSAAVLQKQGHDVKIVDSVVLGYDNPIKLGDEIHLGLSWEQIYKVISDVKPDAVGVSCLYSSQSNNAHKVAELVKKFSKKIIVFMGGAHPSSSPEQVMADDNVDHVIIGEGEETVVEYIECLKNNKGFNKIDGFVYRKNGIIIINPKTKYIDNINKLPFPARHLLPMDSYVKVKIPRGPDLMRKPSTSMITSRGCPMGCVYCSIHTVWGRKYRYRNARNVVEEIKSMVHHFRIKEVFFEDDNLTLNVNNFEKICDLIIKEKIDVKWSTPNGVALWTLTKPLLRKMKQSGCYKLNFGIESGDKETLKFIGKPVDLEYAKDVIRWSNEIGIWTHGFFIFGFPYEKKESIQNTVRFALDNDLDFVSFFIATPYPGTKLLEIMKKEKLIGELDFSHLKTATAVAGTKYFSKEQLDQMQTEFYSAYFRKRFLSLLNPGVLSLRLRRFKSIEDVKFILRFVNRMFGILRK